MAVTSMSCPSLCFRIFEQRQRKLCFVFAVKFKLVGTDAELFGNVGYRLNVGLFCYFDIS